MHRSSSKFASADSPRPDNHPTLSYTNFRRQSVQWVGRRCRAAGLMAAQPLARSLRLGEQHGPAVWEMCRLLSGNGIIPAARFDWSNRRNFPEHYAG